MTTTTDTTRLEQLVLERTKLAADRKALDDRIHELDALLLPQLDNGKNTIGQFTVTVVEPATINKAAIETAFPVTDYPHLYKREVNLDACKQEFSPAALAQFKKPGTRRIQKIA